MQPSVSQVPSNDEVVIRYADGRSVTYGKFLCGIPCLDTPLLVDAWVDERLAGAMQDEFLTLGDDALDSWQAPHWLLKQRFLAACPWLKQFSRAPVIACGSGPSLDQLIPQIRALQGKALIVCAHSTLDRLVAAGITPTICTPSERVAYAKQIQGSVPAETWYAGLPIVPHDVHKFKRHLLVTSNVPVFEWAGLSRRFVGGSTSGTLAVAVSLAVSGGPTYLAGFDMVHGHCAGYPHGEPVAPCGEIMCADGMKRPSTSLLQRTARELAILAADNGGLVQCAPQGALVEQLVPSAPVRCGSLPRPEELCDTVFDPIGDVCSRDPAREQRLAALGASLRSSWDLFVDRVAQIKTAEHCSAAHIGGPEHASLISYLFHSLYGQMAIEKRLGRADAVVDWFRTAALNILDGLRGLMLEATHGC